MLRRVCWSGSLVDNADRSLLVAGVDESGRVMRRQILKKLTIASSLVAMALCGCGGGGNSNSDNPHLIGQIPIAGVGAGTNYSFDLSLVSGSTYYYTDRNNAAVEAVDIPGLKQVATITGTGANAFAGAKPSNANSGPDGVNSVGTLLFVGDVNSVKVIDPATRQVIKTIATGTQGVRSDEGCYDAAHGIYMISTPEASTPYSTFINATTQTVIATVTYTDSAGAPSAGLEQCRYDASTDTFFVNNDGTTSNPHGELDALPGPAIRAIAAGATVNYTRLTGVRMYSEGNCDPTGLALGPGTDIAVGCREGTTAAPLLVQIFNRNTGTLVASVNAGGGDQIEYDAASNRYYNASSRWTATGNAAVNGTCSAASPCTPVLNIIDAATHVVVAQVPTGNNAHSVAVDPASSQVFMPISSSSAPAGCATCDANGFVNAGVAVFSIH
jgi:YVTN family beta-propeller protein